LPQDGLQLRNLPRRSSVGPDGLTAFERATFAPWNEEIAAL
jgi:hypothetical protein